MSHTHFFFASWHCSVLPLQPLGQPKSHPSSPAIFISHTHTFLSRMWLLRTLEYTEGLFVYLKESSAAKSAYMRAHAGDEQTGRDSSVPEGRAAFVHSDGPLAGWRYRRVLPLISLDEMSVKAWHIKAWESLTRARGLASGREIKLLNVFGLFFCFLFRQRGTRRPFI